MEKSRGSKGKGKGGNWNVENKVHIYNIYIYVYITHICIIIIFYRQLNATVYQDGKTIRLNTTVERDGCAHLRRWFGPIATILQRFSRLDLPSRLTVVFNRFV